VEYELPFESGYVWESTGKAKLAEFRYGERPDGMTEAARAVPLLPGHMQKERYRSTIGDDAPSGSTSFQLQ